MADLGFPRPLTQVERDLIAWVLPVVSPGYSALRTMLLDHFLVIGQGRRGEGEILLALPGSEPDVITPLPPVFAYGVVECKSDSIYVTVRELFEGQVSAEFVAGRSDQLPEQIVEVRRWTYSEWAPGRTCPQCGIAPREVELRTGTGQLFVLAICKGDKRIWLHDGSQLVNLLIPATNFYNELMLRKNIRDPKIALNHNLLFGQLDRYSDADLVHAFATYNVLKTRVHAEGGFVVPPEPVQPLGARLVSMFKKQ